MTDGIEVFRDLYVRGDKKEIRTALIGAANKAWVYDDKREADLRAYAIGKDDLLVFVHRATKKLPACSLTLFEEAVGYKVTNIVPLSVGEIPMPKYNQLLKDFHSQVVVEASKKARFSVEITPDMKSIADWVGKEAGDALHKFSVLANKSTGTAHPLDRNRWFDFVIAVHASERSIAPDLLAQWLHEMEGWSEELASELAGEYETLLSFLRHYEEHARGA